jgi:hypothetical protein
MPERRDSPTSFLPLARELRSLDDPADACAAERNGCAAERNDRC